VKKNFGEYQRAAGRGRYEGSLWFGAEHLLVIENSGFIFPFSESYRRIDYRNIQALTIAKTKRGAILTAFLLAALALLGWGIYSELRGRPRDLLFLQLFGSASFDCPNRALGARADVHLPIANCRPDPDFATSQSAQNGAAIHHPNRTSVRRATHG
jgi:hypothetical protein